MLPLFLYSLIISVGGDLYAATVADFSGSDPLIFKNPLRTKQFDQANLNGKSLASCFILPHVLALFFWPALYHHMYLVPLYHTPCQNQQQSLKHLNREGTKKPGLTAAKTDP